MREAHPADALASRLLAAGILVGILAVAWSGLWVQSLTGRLVVAVVAGALPAFVRVLVRRRAVWWATASGVVVAVVALGASVGSTPVAVVVGEQETWNRLGDILPHGLRAAATTPLPLSVDRSPELSALLLLVVAGASALVAWQTIVRRRPLVAVVATATGLAYRWTLVPPDRVVTVGVTALVVALIALRLASPHDRHARPAHARAVVAGIAVVAVAALGSIGIDRTSPSWWNWRDWTFGAGGGPVSLTLDQGYGPLDWPDQPSVVARVEADEPMPLRMQALEGFDGTSWTFTSGEAGPEEETDDAIQLNPDPSGQPRRAVQTITIDNARTQWLPAAGRPIEVRGLGRRRVMRLANGATRLTPSLTPDTTYEVETLVPDVSPSQLTGAGDYRGVDPRLLKLTVGKQIGTVAVPAWGSGALPSQAFGASYADVARLSRRVIGDAASPYQAVNRVETFLRRAGGFRYDEKTTRPTTGQPDLAEFILGRRRGYCQQFAGAMALMLRMNGIPARVAVGFASTSSRFDRDKRNYEILDRDAHSWVEVQFPGYGWIPFDPTPGRSVPNRASVSSPSYVAPDESGPEADVGVGETTEPTAVQPEAERNEPVSVVSEPAPHRDVSVRWLIIPLALALFLGVPAAAKGVRRARRRRGDERARVLGAARELESLLEDVGAPVAPAMTFAERADAVWRNVGIDVGRLYQLACDARFGPTEPAAGSATTAWADLARVRLRLGWRRRIRAGLRLRSLRDR